MERFQKIKTARKKLNVNLICRCCGMENDEKYNILQLFEDGVEFKDKYLDLVGVSVERSDNMPQSVCGICLDKINDFYEFRLMAQNTEKQTREALGLPQYVKKIVAQPAPAPAPIQKVAPRPQKDPKSAVVKLVDLKYSIEDKALIQKAFQRLSTMTVVKNEKRSESPAPSTAQPPAKKARKDVKCKICTEQFYYQTDLQDHQLQKHLPLIARYACGSCRLTFEQLSDFKAHETKHTKEKIPYDCFICLCSFTKAKEFTKHMTNFNCTQKEQLPVTLEDIKCGQCKKKFLTQNLFEWHGCFMKTKGCCAKCGTHYAKKKTLFKHYVNCQGEFVMPEWARDPEATKKIIKPEYSPQKAMHLTKKTGRVASIKAEKELNVTSIAQPTDDDDELDDYDENITYDNYGSDDDYSHSTGLEPEINIQEPEVSLQPEPQIELPNGPRIIDIKLEKSFEEESSVQVNVPLTVDHIRKVKREQIAKQNAIRMIQPIQHKNPFAVKVKKEVENGDQSAVKVLNPFSNSTQHIQPNSKKVFKIPQKLAMKIKKEKNQRSSVIVQSNESQIDEADADPEEEEQMQRIARSIVKEEREVKKSMIVKQFINPLAIQEKPNSTESNSLIISAVSSISEEHIMPQDITPSSDEIENNKMMTEIPAEFTKSIQHNEETRQQPSDNLDEDMNNILSSSIIENNQIEDLAVNNSNNDELDELLEKYGSSDIQDDDIQDLLKFD